MGGHEVQHIDAIVDELSVDDTANKLLEFSPALIIVDTSTPSIVNDISFCAKIKSENPNVVIACVGTFPSKNTTDFFKLCTSHNARVDVVLRGEYEETVLELANKISTNQSYKDIDGIAYLDDSGVLVSNGQLRKTTEEFLDKLPFVSEFYLRHFGESGIRRHFYASINWPYIQILTARGCPYQCSFCNIPSIGSYKTRSINSVVEEFKYIEKNLPFVKEVFIEDDTFPINKKRTIELCQKLIDAKINITWSCNARVNTPKEVLELMKKAGCRLTCVGFESPTEHSLKDIKKKTSLEEQEKFMQDANIVGMKVNGCFILGLPGDTEESIQNTIAYSKKLMPNTVQFYPHMLYPGTESFSWAEKNNMLAHKDWTLWLTKEGFHNTPLRTKEISSDRLLELADQARMKYYTNPKYIFRMFLQSIKSPKELQRMFIAGKSFFPLLMSYILRKR
jgi:radical SAM superfamily enzyme YgiQ (UPF0313 family)